MELGVEGPARPRRIELSQSSGDRLRITDERVRKARSTSESPSMPKPVPSSVTMVRKLGTPASFHVGSPPLVAYSVKRGVSCRSNGPTSTSTGAKRSVLS